MQRDRRGDRPGRHRRRNEDHTDALGRQALRGARIGVWASATGDTGPERWTRWSTAPPGAHPDCRGGAAEHRRDPGRVRPPRDRRGTNSPAWETTLGGGDAFQFGSSGPAAVAGYPNVPVPLGSVGPLPVGLSVLAGDDATVLGLAFAWEQATEVRRAPTYRLTLG